MDRYTISVVSTLEEFEKLSEQWDRLFADSSAKSVFLTWRWLFSWAECYLDEHRKLFVVLVYQDKELLGVAPWYVLRTKAPFLLVRQLEFLGTPESGSDYLDLIIKKGREKQVTDRIYDFLFSEARSQWDTFHFRDISSDSPFLMYFLERIEKDGKYVEVRQGSFCPAVYLTKTDGDFLSTLTPNRREQFRRHARLLLKEGSVVHSSFSVGENERWLDDFFSLYKLKSGHSYGKLPLLIKKFADRSTDETAIQIDMLCQGETQIAGLLHLRHDDTLSMYLMAVDKEFNPKISIGNVLVGLCILQAIQGDILVYDFLKGSEQYKFHWSNRMRTSCTLCFFQGKLTSLSLFLVRFIKYTLKVMLR